MKYLLTIFFLFLIGCGGEMYNTTPQHPSDELADNVTPDVQIENLINITDGTFTVQSSGDTYEMILYKVPFNTNSQQKSSYTITTHGTAPASKIGNSSELRYKDSHEISIANKFHNELRKRSEKLLSEKTPQYRPVLRKGPVNVQEGTEWNNVKVYKGTDNTQKVIDTKCFAVSNYAYFFIEKTLTNPDNKVIDQLKTEFDAIYTTMHEKYGEENDVDSNDKVIILFHSFEDGANSIFGYFNPEDKYNSTTSNYADMFYINNAKLDNINDIFATLAHEFQHMISFDVRHNKGLKMLDVWIDEGLSMQAEYFTGYYDKQSSDYLSEFLTHYYGYSLTDNEFSSSVNYGYSMTFVRYLVERFGDDVVKKIIHSSDTGKIAVSEATNMGFNDLFKDYALALFISGRGISNDPKYNFKTLNIPAEGGLRPVKTIDAGNTIKHNLSDYVLNLIQVKGSLQSFQFIGNEIRGFGYQKATVN